jgi:hypothetical protein
VSIFLDRVLSASFSREARRFFFFASGQKISGFLSLSVYLVLFVIRYPIDCFFLVGAPTMFPSPWQWSSSPSSLIVIPWSYLSIRSSLPLELYFVRSLLVLFSLVALTLKVLTCDMTPTAEVHYTTFFSVVFLFFRSAVLTFSPFPNEICTN